MTISVVAVLLWAQAPTVSADTVLTFGQTTTASIEGVRSGSSTTIETVGGAVQVLITSLNGSPSNITAYFNLNAVSAGPAVNVGGGIFQGFNGSFEITQNSNESGTNYLSGTFTGLTFGFSGGTVATLSASNPPTSLSLTSDVIPYLDAPSGATFTFSGVTPALSIANGTIDNFTASGAATFSATSPEPSSLAIAGLGALGMIAYGLRRRKGWGD
jgi:MYXO-CTERM domain-containing protein